MFKLVNRTETMSLAKFLHMNEVQYNIIQIIPDTSIRDYSTENIARVISNTYKSFSERLKFQKFYIEYKLPHKVSFYIDITLQEVKFYIVVPAEYENLLKEKCSNAWPKASFIRADTLYIPKNAISYELFYRKDDALSLKADKRSSEPLNSIINVLDIMQQGDELGIYYNFIPREQLSWRNKHRDTIERIKKNLPIDKSKINARYITITLIDFIINEFLAAPLAKISDFFGKGENIISIRDETAITKVGMDTVSKLSGYTTNKKDAYIVDTQIVVTSRSNDSKREYNNAISVCESYKVINEDNSLMYKRLKNSNLGIFDYSIKGATKNTMSTVELTNFLQIPGRSILDQHKNITKIDILETKVPKELQDGYISLGECKYKEQFVEAFLPKDKIYGNLPVVLLGPEGCGKSTTIIGMVKNAYEKGEANIVIDFIKSNDLSKSIMKVIPEKDLIVIKCDDNENLQGLGCNELKPKSSNPYDILDYASMQVEQDIDLIDACNNEPLSGRMLKYFVAAGNIVHVQEGKNISNVMECLESHVKRAEYIKYVKDGPREIFEDLEEEIGVLSELDEVKEFKNKGDGEIRLEIVGTKYGSISYIADRIEKLKVNNTLKHMYRKSASNNIDIFKAVEEKKTILIMMPGIKFKGIARDVLVTYWVGKTWLVSELKGDKYDGDDPPRLNVFIDELYQCKVAERRITSTLEQTRKFGTRYFLSCHHVTQLAQLQRTLESEAHYILMHGSDKKNYFALKEELEPFTLEDLMNVKEFSALNLIKYSGGLARFITKLPPPVAN